MKPAHPTFYALLEIKGAKRFMWSTSFSSNDASSPYFLCIAGNKKGQRGLCEVPHFCRKKPAHPTFYALLEIKGAKRSMWSTSFSSNEASSPYFLCIAGNKKGQRGLWEVPHFCRKKPAHPTFYALLEIKGAKRSMWSTSFSSNEANSPYFLCFAGNKRGKEVYVKYLIFV